MSKYFLIPALLLFFPMFSNGQSTFGLSLNGFAPVGELKKDSPGIWGGGFSSDIAFQINGSPIHLGGMLGVTRYGSEVRDGWHGEDLGDVRIRRNNEMAYMLGLIRVKPPVSGNFQPYADFFGGFSYIATSAHFRDGPLKEEWDSVTDIDDFAMNYGFGGGLEIFINEFLSLDFNVKSIKSSSVEYLTPQSVSYNKTDEVYDLTVKKSRFDHLNFGFGIKLLMSEW
ncbi:hypothetical protein [Roseivirga echinicomitans]|nr:hypothetical protein [Roseivirga echinicomitans]